MWAYIAHISRQICDLETLDCELELTRDLKAIVVVSRPGDLGPWS